MRTAQLGLRTALAAFAAFALLSVPVDAESEISIPFGDLIFGAPGSVVTLAEVEVDEDLVGRTCFLAVVAENQASVHMGNDLIVSTGTSEAVIVGVEDEANGGTNQTYEMVVGSTITAQLRIGPDGMSSLGFGLSFDCDSPPTSAAGPDLGRQQADRSTTTSTSAASVAPSALTTAPSTTVAPTTAPSTTVSPTSAPTTVPAVSSVPATVAGAVTNGPLPETPAAQAVAGAPAYTG